MLLRASVQSRIIAGFVYLAVIVCILNSPSGLLRLRYSGTNVHLVEEC